MKLNRLRSKNLFFIGLTLAFYFCLSLVGSAQNLKVKATDVAPQNYIKLDWFWDPTAPTGNWGYTLYQKDSDDVWQTTSTNYDKVINVLNPYPNGSNANTLKTWMETNGYGKDKDGVQKIFVTPVKLSDFNANPNSYLNPSNYEYDVIFFGSWDCNGPCQTDNDISDLAKTAVENFLLSGRGVLFGHDTQTSLYSNTTKQLYKNFVSLRGYSNLYIEPKNDRRDFWYGNTKVKAIRDGFLLKYPHKIPLNTTLTVPLSHSTGQMAKGVVWMEFEGTTYGQAERYRTPSTDALGNLVAIEERDVPAANNFYLTTWNNAAMIQTGHSSGAATPHEQQIIANTLWYLAQFTTETTADVRSALDEAKPDTPTANRDVGDNGKIKIKTKDNGTTYQFKVKATNTSNYDNFFESNTLAVTNTTGLKGYYILENCSPTGTPVTTGDPTVLGSDNVEVAYTVKHKANYVHIVAVDYAGNISAVKTIAPAITPAYDFDLSCQGMGQENYIKLTWYPSTLDGLCGGGSGSYRYTINQWDEVLGRYQPASANYGEIKVLNVYPVKGDNLKNWMEVDELGGADGIQKAGRDKIKVTAVSIDNFNTNPDSYLKIGGEYQYDAIMFGSWNVNNYKDLSITARDATEAFLKTGRGVLFGHDVPFRYDYPQVHTNFIYLADKYLNMDLSYTGTDGVATAGKIKTLGSSQVKAIRKGFLLEFPWTIPHNSVLTIPFAHSSAQLAKGIVWMNFHNPTAGIVVEDKGGTNDFYLTTWNNTAMIQTGHSNGAATSDEKKIIANTLWYLAQFTTATTADMMAAQDKAAPDTPTTSRNSTDCGKVNLKAKDNGTTYKYYIEATDLTNSDFVKKSKESECEVKTGLKGYYVTETTSATHTGDITGTLIPATDNQDIVYNVIDQSKYIHIQAIDHGGNRSTIKTLNPIPTISYGATDFCPVGSVSVTRLPATAIGGTYSVSPAGLSINATNGTINLASSTAGDYTITYNYNTDGCPKATTTVKVKNLPLVSFEQVLVEGNEGSSITFKVKLSNGHCSDANATVAYTTVNGTAVAPGDYTTASGTIIFAPGETEKTIPVATIGNDNLIEGDEEFTLKLSSPVNCKFATGTELSATGRIKDQTDGSIIVKKSLPAVGDASEPGTDGAFTIRYKTDNATNPNKDIKLSFKVTGGTVDQDYNITAGADVSLNADKVSGIAIIRKNQNGVVVPIKVRDNYIVQGDRTLQLEITGIVP